MTDRVANRFMLQAVQEWGQSEAERIKAVQDLIDAAGFKATATCGPVFGAIWPAPCTGDDGHEASDWLHNLTKAMPRGKYEREIDYINDALNARMAALTTNKSNESGSTTNDVP